MVELRKLLKLWDILFDHKDHHIRCFPHIINICTGHVIKKITDIDLTEVADAWMSSLPQDLNDHRTYQDALVCDPIALGHVVVQALCASGQCQDVFEDYIWEGNEKGYWEERCQKYLTIWCHRGNVLSSSDQPWAIYPCVVPLLIWLMVD